jgi:hypothetical protein
MPFNLTHPCNRTDYKHRSAPTTGKTASLSKPEIIHNGKPKDGSRLLSVDEIRPCRNQSRNGTAAGITYETPICQRVIPHGDAQPDCLCHGDLSPTMGSGRTAFSTGNSGKRASQPESTKSLFRYSSKRGITGHRPVASTIRGVMRPRHPQHEPSSRQLFSVCQN